MRIYTDAECIQWCSNHLVDLDDRGRPVMPPDYHSDRFELSFSAFALTGFGIGIEAALQPREDCLLWVTGSDVWTTSRDLHMYYRLRQSYGDHRLLAEAPGHLFMGYERADAASFISLVVMYGWDAYILPAMGYSRAYISHDEWVEFGAVEADDLAGFAQLTGTTRKTKGRANGAAADDKTF